MTKLIQSLAAAGFFAVALTGTASAQFSLKSLPGVSNVVGGGGSAAPAGDLGGQQDVLVRSYVAANKDVLTANSKMAEALGLKDAAATSKATSDALTEGATKDNLEASNKAVSASTDAVAAELAKQPVLDAQSKALFATGLGHLATGVHKYVGVGKNVKVMGSSLSSASPLMLPKLQSAVYVVSNFPSSMTSVSTALKNAISFAQSHDIPVPADATQALAAL
jgi:hypothetical protein